MALGIPEGGKVGQIAIDSYQFLEANYDSAWPGKVNENSAP
jgi:hypothetical protein